MRTKTGASNMTKLLSTIRNATLGLSLLIGAGQVLAETATQNDGEIKQEMTKFSEENEKMREDHIQQMRDLHVKHINELYDKKLANNKEMGILWRQLKPGDKEANKALRGQIKEKQKAFKKEIESFRSDFQEKILKSKNKGFHHSMKDRIKEMKGKHKE